MTHVPPPGPPAPIRIANIEAPTLKSVRPLPPAEKPTLEPYRVLFPLGAACAIAGTLPWLAHALGLGAWPGMMHAALMVQGFELAFVTGFLLTAMPAFTHGAKCRAWELAGTATGVTLFAALRLAGFEAIAHAAFTLTLAWAAFAVARRVRLGAAAPPEEFALVAVGVALGLAGGAMQALAAAGWLAEPSPRFALRLVSRGMVLALVLGLGGLLVPTFAMIPDPLRIPGIARAGQRGPRRAFLSALALLLGGSFVADALAHHVLGAWLRAVAGSASLLLAWKLWRLPPRPMRIAWTLWASGVLVLVGLVAAAIAPAHEIAAWHVVFVGGYGLLTMSIATRVVVSHGGHPHTDEPIVLGVPALACLALALLARLAGGEVDPSRLHALAGAGTLFALAWALWLAHVLPRVRRTKRTLMMPGAPARR